MAFVPALCPSWLKTLHHFPLQVIIKRLCDLHGHKVTYRQRLLTLYDHLIIHLHTVKLCAGQVATALLLVNHHLVGLAHTLLVLFVTYLLLHLHYLLRTCFFLLSRNIVHQLMGRGVLLMTVREYPHAVQPHIGEKLLQVLHIIPRLTGEARNERRADAYARHPVAHIGYEVGYFVSCYLAFHRLQHIV